MGCYTLGRGTSGLSSPRPGRVPERSACSGCGMRREARRGRTLAAGAPAACTAPLRSATRGRLPAAAAAREFPPPPRPPAPPGAGARRPRQLNISQDANGVPELLPGPRGSLCDLARSWRPPPSGHPFPEGWDPARVTRSAMLSPSPPTPVHAGTCSSPRLGPHIAPHPTPPRPGALLSAECGTGRRCFAGGP